MSEQPNQFEEAEAPLYPKEPTPPVPLSPEVKAKADQLQREIVAAMTHKPVSEIVAGLRGPLVADEYMMDEDVIDGVNAERAEAADALEHLATQVEALETDASLLPAALQRIEALAEENKRLRKAIKSYVDPITYEDILARAALGDTPAGLDRQGPRTDAG